MARLYELVQKAVSAGVKDESIGFNIIESVLSNRSERDDIYRRGEAKNFKNKELSRVLTGLERLADDPNIEAIDDSIKLGGLKEHHDITRLNYVYDALVCSYQCSGDLRNSAEFLGSVIKKKAELFSHLPDYDKKNVTDIQAYNEILTNLKNSIRKKYQIILD